MKNIITLIITLLVACTNLFAQTTPLKMMTYNIQGHSVNDAKIQNIAKVINTAVPDVVSVQEIDNRKLQLTPYDYFADLAKAVNMEAAFLPLEYENNYGIGILSKVKPIKTETKVFAPTDPGNKYPENRGYLIAEFTDYIFISTHYSTSDTERDIMAEWLINYVKTATKTVFVAGDFNAAPAYRAMMTLQNAGFIINSDTQLMTYPSTGATKHIDMVLQYNKNEGNKKYGVVNSYIPKVDGLDLATVSDHFPVVVELQEGLEVNPFIVTTTEMSTGKPGSLLYAFTQLKDKEPATIRFNLAEDVILFTEPRIALDNKIVTIDGINQKTGNKVTIQGGSTFMEVNTQSQLTLKNLVVSNFTAIAFKISVTGKLNAECCIFKDNKTGNNNGGVMRISNAEVNVNRCLFEGNEAFGSYGGGSLCVYTGSDHTPVLHVTNSTFVQNKAVSGAAIAVNGVKGKLSAVDLYVANCTFANNRVQDRGGAIYLQHHEPSVVFAPVVVNNTFVGNITEKKSADGGAFCIWGRSGNHLKPVFLNNLFSRNYYLEAVGATACDGKVFTTNNSVLPVFKRNAFGADDAFMKTYGADNDYANPEVEAIFEKEVDSPWNDLAAGINLRTAELSGPMKVAEVSENSICLEAGIETYSGVVIPATDQLGRKRPAVPGQGAVEFFDPYLVTTPVMDATVEGSLLNILANIPDNTDVIVNFRLDSDELPFNVTRVLLENKKVTINGLNKTTGNRVKVSGGSTFLEFKNCKPCAIKNMEVSGFIGIAIKASGSSLAADNCLFADNKDGSKGGNNGGVARLSSTSGIFTNCEFRGNTAKGSYGGGALCVYGKGGQLEIKDCLFADNVTDGTATGAVDGGGAISLCSGVAKIRNSVFVGNTSNTNGGAVKVWTKNTSYDVPKLEISECTFEKNKARSGGAVVVYGTRYIDQNVKLSIVNCTFGNNKCNERGGALYIANENEGAKGATTRNGSLLAVVANNTFVGNMTAKASSADGGALAFWGRGKSGNSSHIVNNIFAHNYFSKAVENQHNDARFFSTKGLVAKNNIYDEGDYGFDDAAKGYAVLNPDHGNISYNGTTDKLFMYPAVNPWNAEWESAELSGDIKVVVLAVESIAAEKGLTTYAVDGVEYVPVKDQSGINRGGKPSVGSIQNEIPTSVDDIEVAEAPAIVKAGNELILATPAEVCIFDVTGRLVQVSPAAERVSLEDFPNGIYAAKAGNCVVKFVK